MSKFITFSRQYLRIERTFIYERVKIDSLMKLVKFLFIKYDAEGKFFENLIYTYDAFLKNEMFDGFEAPRTHVC